MSSSWRLALASFSTAAAIFAASSAANAETPKEKAEALLERGRKLLADGKVSEACTSFEASQRVIPDASTLLQLGNCYQRDGRTASAWQSFREAITLAHDAGQADRERYARERASILEHDVARMTISISSRAAGQQQPQQELSITRDGVVVGASDLGMPIPIDPGRHTVSARAPGKKGWSAIVEIGRTGSREPTVVEVPLLEDLSATDASAMTPPPPVATESPAAQADDTAGSPLIAPPNKALFIGGIATAGAGVIVSSIATGFALSAQSKEDDLEQLTASRGAWNAQYQKTYDDGSSAATTATVLFVTGGLMLAVGVTLMIVNWPRSSSSSSSSRTNAALSTGSWASF